MITLKEALKTKKLWFGLIVLAIGFKASQLSTLIILKLYPVRVIPDDLIFDLLPYYEFLEYATDIVAMIMMISFIIYIIKLRLGISPMVMTGIGLGYIIRGFINILTPLGKPTGMPYNHGISGFFSKYHGLQLGHINEGMFPSGHLFSSVVYLFFIDRKKHPKFFWVMVTLNVVDAILMISSRGHYSIDVVGGIMLAVIIGQNIWRFKDKLVLS